MPTQSSAPEPEDFIDPADMPEESTSDDSPKWHAWAYRTTPTAEADQYEFGMPITERDARDRIARMLGVDALPEGATLTHEEPETPEPAAENLSVPIPSPIPEPEPEPEPSEPTDQSPV